MILQALKNYYDRKVEDPNSDIAPEGFEKKAIPFLVVIDNNGEFLLLEDTREKIGNRFVSREFLLPRSQGRSGNKSYEITFLLWDHIGYLFEYPETDDKSSKQHKSWLQSLDKLPSELMSDEGVSAILKFYKLNRMAEVKNDPKWVDCTNIQSCNLTFRLSGDTIPIPCRPKVQEYVVSKLTNEVDGSGNAVKARCLITGEIGEIARTHSRTPINKDTKSLISFQRSSGYDSYGKEQGFNAPICKSAEFAYTTALNHLLRKDSLQRLQIGDATTVFWAEKSTNLETEFIDIFGDSPKDDPDRGVKAVRNLFKSIETGSLAADEKNNRFYVLGLSPNAARIAVRFWIVDTVAGMSEKLIQHFADLRMVHGPWQKDTLSLFRLLVSTAVQGKAENVPPNLAGETMRAILSNLPYPQTLLQAVVRRIRAEQAAKDKKTGNSIPNVSYERASLIKACINRRTRFNNPQIKEELKVSLDKNNINIGYRLGRLFATLEKIQKESFTQNGGKEPNSTIRDRFYGAASGTPVTVFSNLMRLKNHHLAKIESPGRRIYFEKLIGEIMDTVVDIPGHLPITDQGRFAIGYYHQNHDFYPTKEKNSTDV